MVLIEWPTKMAIEGCLKLVAFKDQFHPMTTECHAMRLILFQPHVELSSAETIIIWNVYQDNSAVHSFRQKQLTFEYSTNKEVNAFHAFRHWLSA